MDTLNIAIPVYNEAENIARTVLEIRQKVTATYCITVIYDFPEDTTIPVVKSLIRDGHPIRLMHNELGRGVCNAIKTGFKNLTGTIVVVMADSSDDISAIDNMAKLAQKGYAVVCGSRYMRGGKHIGGPRLKKTLSRIAGISLHYLIGIPTHDITNSFKLYNKNMLESMTLESTGGFEIGMEVVVKAYASGFKVGEVPSTWKDRVSGASRFKLFTWLPRYIHWYLFALKYSLFSKPQAL
jgi:glycosyltransferase involved in cell wall biosynthesis